MVTRSYLTEEVTNARAVSTPVPTSTYPRVSGPGFLNVSGSVKLAVEEKCRAESHEHCGENDHDSLTPG